MTVFQRWDLLGRDGGVTTCKQQSLTTSVLLLDVDADEHPRPARLSPDLATPK